MKASEESEKKLKSYYEEEFARSNEYHAQLIGKMQELLRIVGESESLYQNFPGAMARLEQRIKQLSTSQFQVKILERNIKEEGKEADIETVKLKAILSQKEADVTYLSQQQKLLAKSKEHHEKRTLALQQEVQRLKDQHQAALESTAKSVKASCELQTSQLSEEVAKLKEQLLKANASLDKAHELEKVYQEEIELLKTELAKALSQFSLLEKEIVTAGSAHNVRQRVTA